MKQTTAELLPLLLLHAASAPSAMTRAVGPTIHTRTNVPIGFFSRGVCSRLQSGNDQPRRFVNEMSPQRQEFRPCFNWRSRKADARGVPLEDVLGESRSRPSRSAIALGAAALAGCVTAGGSTVDDGFRVRLAAGCETEKACEELKVTAVLRRDSCSVLDTRNRPRRDCTAERQDVAHADLLLRRVQVAAAATSAREQQEAAAEARRAQAEAAATVAAQAVAQAKEACAEDRDARIATLRSALRAASKAQQANRRRAAYIKGHCRTVMVDGSATTRCPAGAPAGTLDATGDVVVDRVPPDLRRAADQAIERSDATHCNDLDANNPNSPELAGAYVEPDEAAPAPVPTAPATTPSSSSGDGSLRCCDGTLSPSCGCSGSHRGCCSHHHGVCGCAN